MSVIEPSIEYYANKVINDNNEFTIYKSKQLSVLCDLFITKWKKTVDFSKKRNNNLHDKVVDFTKDLRLVFTGVNHVINNNIKNEDIGLDAELEADDELLTELIKFNEFSRNIKTLSNITEEQVLSGHPGYISILNNSIEYIVNKNIEMEQFNETINKSVKETLAKVNETLLNIDEMISQKKFV